MVCLPMGREKSNLYSLFMYNLSTNNMEVHISLCYG